MYLCANTCWLQVLQQNFLEFSLTDETAISIAQAVIAMAKYLLVGVGQCGTQVASEVDALVTDQTSAGLCEVLLVDSEPKSILAVNSIRPAKCCKSIVATDSSGRGNNWAHGYAGSAFETTNSFGLSAIEFIRDTLEQFDKTPAVVMSHAWGGGTGSGLGSFLLEKLRDGLLGSNADLISLGVCPFLASGSPLQSVNTTLCAATVRSVCSGALVQYNDELLSSAERQYYSASAAGAGAVAASHSSRRGVAGSGAGSVGMSAMNRVLAERMAAALPLQGYQDNIFVCFPSLLRHESCSLSTITLTSSVDSKSASLHSNMVAASLSDLRRNRRRLALLSPPLLRDSIARQTVNPPHVRLLLRAGAPAAADPLAAKWAKAEMTAKYTSSRETLSPHDSATSRSTWLFEGQGTCVTQEGHASINLACEPGSDSVQLLVDETWQGAPQAVALDSGPAACAPLASFAELTSSKVKAGAYLHLLEPYGVDAQHVQDACHTVETWCSSFDQI